jgi:hypothetical protein
VHRAGLREEPIDRILSALHVGDARVEERHRPVDGHGPPGGRLRRSARTHRDKTARPEYPRSSCVSMRVRAPFGAA